jgi:hypothetical protein
MKWSRRSTSVASFSLQRRVVENERSNWHDMTAVDRLQAREVSEKVTIVVANRTGIVEGPIS